MSAMLQPRDICSRFVSQEDRTALIWAAMNVVEVMVEQGADVYAKEKVRNRYCVITGVGGNDQRMFGTGLPDLGTTGRECSMHCSCGPCHEEQLTILPSCTRNMPNTGARSWCCSS
jgi:hypothetical protein